MEGNIIDSNRNQKSLKVNQAVMLVRLGSF